MARLRVLRRVRPRTAGLRHTIDPANGLTTFIGQTGAGVPSDLAFR